MATSAKIREATFIRIHQLSLLMDLRDGPLRLFLMNGFHDCIGRERKYDICGLQILPWVLNPNKGWVSVSDGNLYAITPKGLEAIEEWEKHQFDEIDVNLREPVVKVRPAPTAHLRKFKYDEIWAIWEAERNIRPRAITAGRRKSSTPSLNG